MQNTNLILKKQYQNVNSYFSQLAGKTPLWKLFLLENKCFQLNGLPLSQPLSRCSRRLPLGWLAGKVLGQFGMSQAQLVRSLELLGRSLDLYLLSNPSPLGRPALLGSVVLSSILLTSLFEEFLSLASQVSRHPSHKRWLELSSPADCGFETFGRSGVESRPRSAPCTLVILFHSFSIQTAI